MDMYAITAEHPLLGILRNVPLEKTIDYADARCARRRSVL